MGVLTRFRLDGGTNQQAARKLLPAEGLLRRVVNMRLRRDNELAVRPGFTALARDVYNNGTSSYTAVDLFNYDERLFALGHLSGSQNANRIQLFEYVAQAKGWVRVTTRLPGATRLRELGAPPDQSGGVLTSSCAVYDGIGLHVYQIDDGSNTCFGLVFRTRDDATLVFGGLTLFGAGQAIVTVGHKFYAFGLNSFSAPTLLQAKSYTPASSETFSAVVTSLTTDSVVFAAAAVSGATGGYVVVYRLAGDLVVKHFNDSDAQQMTRTIAGVVTFYLAIAADSVANAIVIGYLDDADDLLKYRTISLTAGTDIAGPTNLSATTTDSAITVAIDTGGNVTAAGNITSTTPQKVVFVGTPINTPTWTDVQLDTDILCTFNNTPVDLVLTGFFQGGAGSARAFGVHGMGVEEASIAIPAWYRDFGTGIGCPSRIGSLTRDTATGLFYSTSLRQNNDLEATASVAEWAYGVNERRQAAVSGGLLHIAGALPLIFDGRFPFEIGFGEKPIIYSLASSNGAGSIASSADYFIQVFPEMVDSRGNVHRGPPSDVYSITTGAADDTITGSIGRLHGFRNSGLFQGAAFRMVICRTAALADKSAGENLYRETSITCAANSTNWGATVAFTLTASDDTLRARGETQGTIYTQSQTPIPHQAPPPSNLLWPTNERVAAAGLPRTNQWLQSKLKFPAEATHFSDADLPQFQGSTDEAILAIGAIGGSIVAFTRRTISLWQGEGPDHSGQGEFSFSGFLSREGGITDWRSLCETDEGLFFQRETDQICQLLRNGSADWTVGQAVRDELVTYPVVLATAFLRKQRCVVFAVENAAANAGELLVYDLRRKVWFIDTIYAKALAEYQGRLVYADSTGAVFQQDVDPGSGAMPDHSFETFDFDFGTGLSWGEIMGVGVVGTKVADCTGALAVTYDSGLNYTTIETFTLTTAGGYVANKPLQLEKAVPDRKCSRFGLKFTITGGTGTEGIRVNELVLETQTAPGMTRLPSRDTH